MTPKQFTAVCGVSESGKTTFVNRYLLNAPGLSARFLFDPDGEFADRLKLPPVTTPAELDRASGTGWVSFDPGQMFPGRADVGFRFFCAWCHRYASVTPGRKIIVVDEVWKFCTPQSVPGELAVILQTGRKVGLEGMFLTQRPNRMNGTIHNELTELVSFRLQERAAVEKVVEFDERFELVRKLPAGTFRAINLKTGGLLDGRVF